MKKRVRVGNLKVFYRQEGKGFPLLLLHGWGKSSDAFLSLTKLLSRDFTTLSPDLPGFGKTPLPLGIWGIKKYAQFVEAFCQRIGLSKVCLLGHSFGGRIAIELASCHSERIEKLVLTGVPVLRQKRLKRFCFWTAAKFSKLIFFLPPFCFFKNQFRKFLYFFAGERDYYRSSGKMREIFKKVIGIKQLKSLRKIKMPTLIVWGEKDRVTPLFHARALHRKIKDSTLEVVAGASHKLPYERSKEFFKKIVPFLKD